MVLQWRSFCVLMMVFFGVVNGFTDCGSKTGNLKDLHIVGCDDQNVRCVLHRNSNATVSISFTVNDLVSKLQAVVHGIVLGVEIPFALPNPDACEDSGLVCPLNNDETVYTYAATLPVLKKYPKVTVDVKWELKDQDGEALICVLIPAKIQ